MNMRPLGIRSYSCAPTRPHLGARLRGGVHQDLVKRNPADAEDRGPGDRDDIVDDRQVVVEGHPAATHRGCNLQQCVEDPDPLEHLHARGLDHVRREGVAREPILVDHADAQAGPRQHRGQRRAGTARAYDDDVEGLTHASAPRTGVSRLYSFRKGCERAQTEMLALAQAVSPP
jgi:hypothetical protein